MSSSEAPRCRHVKVNGTQCGSPAVRSKSFCCCHQQAGGRHLRREHNSCRRVSRFSRPGIPQPSKARGFTRPPSDSKRLFVTNTNVTVITDIHFQTRENEQFGRLAGVTLSVAKRGSPQPKS
jgi:hypothetical protein